jgi:hypothetical protein
MILARLAHAIRTQNWFAVALEFVIVIAGVVIGFQITEWRGEQADRESEQIYLSRLYRDMEQSVCRIRQEQEGVREWNSRARVTLDALLNNDPDAVDDSGFELVASTRIQTGSPYRATLNELVSGGQMNLISNGTLRAHIAETDAQLTSYAEYIQILVHAQGTFLNQVHSRLRPTPDDVYAITYDFDALAQDDAFLNSLGHALRITHANISWLGDMADVAESLRVAVGEEIGRDVSLGPDCPDAGAAP